MWWSVIANPQLSVYEDLLCNVCESCFVLETAVSGQGLPVKQN